MGPQRKHKSDGQCASGMAQTISAPHRAEQMQFCGKSNILYMVFIALVQSSHTSQSADLITSQQVVHGYIGWNIKRVVQD